MQKEGKEEGKKKGKDDSKDEGMESSKKEGKGESKKQCTIKGVKKQGRTQGRRLESRQKECRKQ